MKRKIIYIGHSREFDFENELYTPLRASALASTHRLIFPHDADGHLFVSARDLKTVDLFVAEVSYPSLGLGIELGLAHCFGMTPLCIHKSSVRPSSSLQGINCITKAYSDINELLQLIEVAIGDASKTTEGA